MRTATYRSELIAALRAFADAAGEPDSAARAASGLAGQA